MRPREAIAASEFLSGRDRGDVRMLARTLTLAENDPRSAYAILADAGAPGQAHILGVTGPPGVGKSSLVNALVAEIRTAGERAAVLAIDPSSPFKGGALLGDRIRMGTHASDPGVYIRSMATRGVLGGLSRAAWVGVRVLAAWGFDWIIIETAGVGQSEIDIVDLADTTLLILSPGLGDDVQIMKAGIIEIADLFVINKADHPGAERVRNALAAVLAKGVPEPGTHAEPAEPAAEQAGTGPEVHTTIATATGPESGVAQLFSALQKRFSRLERSDALAAFRARRMRVEIRRAAMSLFGELVDREMDDRAADGFLEAEAPGNGFDPSDNVAGTTDPMAEAQRLIERLIRPEVLGTGSAGAGNRTIQEQ